MIGGCRGRHDLQAIRDEGASVVANFFPEGVPLVRRVPVRPIAGPVESSRIGRPVWRNRPRVPTTYQ